MRLLNLIKSIKQLRVIVVGLVEGLRSSGHIFFLLFIVIYIFAVVAVGQFGRNDPANYGNVQVAMLTLFQVSTLASWSGVGQVSIYGCDVYGDGLYDWEGQNYTTVDQRYKKTLWGSFPLWDCVEPSEEHGYTEVFYIIFTTVSALVVLSLVVGAITMVRPSSVKIGALRPPCKVDFVRGLLLITPLRCGARFQPDHNHTNKTHRPLFFRIFFLKAMFTAFSNMEMVELFDEYARLVDKRGQGLSPFHELGRKIDVILSDKPVPPSIVTWSGGDRCNRDAVIYICYKIDNSVTFQIIITVAILMVAVVVGFETDSGPTPFINAFNHCALALFVFECNVKIAAQAITPNTSWKRAFLKYINDGWNKFDFIVVLVGLVGLLPGNHGGGLIVLRLLRILKIFRLAKSLPRLRAIIEALGDGATSALWVLALCLILNYILACLGVILFRDNDPFHFGRLDSAFYTIWRVETLDNWDDVLRINVYGCSTVPSSRGYPLRNDINQCEPEKETAYGWLAVSFFVFTIVFGGLLLPTVLVGIVAISFEHAWSKYSEERIMAAILNLMVEQIEDLMTEWWSVDRLTLIKTVFSILDTDGRRLLDIRSIEEVLMYLVKVYIAAVPYDIMLQPQEEEAVRADIRDLFLVMDSSGDAMISLVELISFFITIKRVQIQVSFSIYLVSTCLTVPAFHMCSLELLKHVIGKTKLRLTGVIDDRSLNDATRPRYNRNKSAMKAIASVLPTQEPPFAESASSEKGGENGANGQMTTHANIRILTGSEVGMADDLLVCIAEAAKKCNVDALELERYGMRRRFTFWYPL